MPNPLLLRLSKLDTLSTQEQDVLRSAIVRERDVERHEEIIRQGSSPTESTLLLDGFTGRTKVLSDGQRQITAIHVAGDFVDLHSFLLSKVDHSVSALTQCRVGSVPHDRLRQICEEFPHLGRMLWLTTLIDGSIHREWLVAMGRRTATQHMAHIFCELYLRLQVVERTDGESFEFPLTQAEVADTMGLSSVHVNRVLQELRSLHLISWRSQVVTIHDYGALAELAEFDPTYLNLEGKPL